MAVSPYLQRKRVSKRRYRGGRRTLLLVACLLLGLILYTSSDNIVRIWGMYREIQELEEQIAEMEAENQRLAEMVKVMETGAWVEQAAREELGLVKPGEIILIPRWEE
ncbi:MAG TPA: septum formation initiator family protein [Firmicutes bacterium]|nr:septum formation initiator family protein [Bacillota bacterium]